MNVSLLAPLPLPSEMAAWDAASITRYGVKNEMLMENASREALAVLMAETGNVAGSRVLVLAGPGNNGGDAIALARHLLDRRAQVLVLHTAAKSRYKGVSRYHVQLAARVGVDMHMYSPSFDFFRFHPDVVVDGLLGTGFHGGLRPEYLDLVRQVNQLRSQAFVLALDIPSGLDGASGRPRPEAVRAHSTVTFEAAKTGLAMPWAREFTGRLHVRPIGIPRKVRAEHPASCLLLDAPGLRRVLAAEPEALAAMDPRRAPEMHKGTAGRVIVAGGSQGFTGAPQLAALGALRAGAGLVSLAAPAGLMARMGSGFPEIMTLALGQDDGEEWDADMGRDLAERLDRCDALALGPGLGRDAGAGRFLAAFLEATAQTKTIRVLDADALWWLAREPGLTALLKPTDILTPHPGEMALLLAPGSPDTAAVQAERLAAARTLARNTGAVVVLKGAGTVVAAPQGPVLLCAVASPSLATGGTGDVLAGVTAAMAARWPHCLGAASLAVWVHAHAGTHLDTEFPQRGNLAREVAYALPRALKELFHDPDGARHNDHQSGHGSA